MPTSSPLKKNGKSKLDEMSKVNREALRKLRHKQESGGQVQVNVPPRRKQTFPSSTRQELGKSRLEMEHGLSG